MHGTVGCKVGSTMQPRSAWRTACRPPAHPSSPSPCPHSCGYCTFATPPAPGRRAYMTLEEVLAVARLGAEQGCTEALFTLGGWVQAGVEGGWLAGWLRSSWGARRCPEPG